MKWRGQKSKFLAVLDIHTRYEMNEVVKHETFEEEVSVLERLMSWAGVPRSIRTDSFGAHMVKKCRAGAMNTASSLSWCQRMHTIEWELLKDFMPFDGGSS